MLKWINKSCPFLLLLPPLLETKSRPVGFKFGQKMNNDYKIQLLEQLVNLQNAYFRRSK